MTELKVEEPKTVVEEETRYRCDKCNGVFEDAMSYTLSKSARGARETGHLCRDCSEADEYATLVDLHEDKVRIRDGINLSIDMLIYVLSFALGAAIMWGGYGVITAKGFTLASIVLSLFFGAIAMVVYIFCAALIDEFIYNFSGDHRD